MSGTSAAMLWALSIVVRVWICNSVPSLVLLVEAQKPVGTGKASVQTQYFQVLPCMKRFKESKMLV